MPVEILLNIFNFFMHIDHHLAEVIADYGVWVYLILFVIIFCETGLVVTPFLPGDSLLFAAGALSAASGLHIGLLWIVLVSAAILGNSANYAIGTLLASRILGGEHILFVKKEYLERTQEFYEKHGGKTLILTRFMPILRTFAPFLAGVGKMAYLRFQSYNIAGGIVWVTAFVMGGYFFGNIPVIKKNFSMMILIIIVVSLLPAVIEFWKHRSAKK